MAINWKAAERTLIAEGDYDATIGETKVQEQRTNKKLMNLYVKFIINEDGDFKGRSIPRYFPLTDKALWACRDFLIEMGSDEDDFEDTDDEEEFYDNVRELASRIVGDSCVITVEHNEDQNGKVDRDGNPVVYANVSKVTAA